MQGSILANRRMLGSWNLPVRRLGLGDATSGTPAPRLSTAEAEQFVRDNRSLRVVGAPIRVEGGNFVNTLDDYFRLDAPDGGVVVQKDGNDFLVWYDYGQPRKIRVYIVTGESIHQQNPTGYEEPPDTGITGAIDALAGGVGDALKLAAVVGGLVLAVAVFSTVRHR